MQREQRRGWQRKRRRPPDLRRPYSSTIGLRALAAMQLRQRRRHGLSRQQLRNALHQSAEILGLHPGGLRQRVRWRRSGPEHPTGREGDCESLNAALPQFVHERAADDFLARVGSFPDSLGSCDCSAALPAPPYGANSCRQGYVWRNAFDGDVVCVPPAWKTQVQIENGNAGSTRAGGNSNTCKSGFVWRAARPADLVCVTPQSRAQVKLENDTAWDRVAHIAGQ